MAQNSILQNMLKKTIAKNTATAPVIPTPVTKTQGTNNNIIFGGQAPEVKPVVQPVQQPGVVKAPNPITQTSNVQLQTPYQQPVATKSQPVVELGTPKPAPTPEVQSVNYNPSIYEPYKNYSKDDVANWLDQASVMSSQGRPLSEQDQLVGRYMQRRLQEMNTPQTIEDPTKAMIEQTRLDQEAARKRLEEQSNTLYSSEEARIKAYYDKRKSDTLAANDRVQQTAQAATSFSGFGRSTFNADQQVQIQKEAEQSLAIDQAEMQASLDKYNAQLQGATQEQLAQYDNRIAELQGKSMEFKQKQVEQINAYNAQTAQSMTESIDNLIAFSQQNQPATPLTEEEKQQASAYAQLIVGTDGKVDEGMVKNIPPRLLNEAILQGATLKKSILPKEDKYSFSNLGQGVVAVQNPNTGKVEFKQAKELVDTGDWSASGDYLINKKTGEQRPIQQGGGGATALDTIKKWEGFRDKAYQDATGTWTLGYGFTNVNGQPVQPGMTMDRGTADQLLQQEISQRQNFMNYITVPLSESQKAALSSFEFNLGSGIWEKNAMPILEKINAGDLKGAGDILKQYANSKGQKLQGLANRRNEEARLLSDTSSTTAPQQTYTKEQVAGNQKLFDDLNKLSTSYKSMRLEQQSVDSLLNNQGKGVTDQVLITVLNKMIDPTSVVKEGEYARTAEGQSKYAQIQGWISKLSEGGGGITQGTRQDIVNTIKSIYNNQTNYYKNQEGYYKEMAPQLGSTPEFVSSYFKDFKDGTTTPPATQQEDDDVALFNKYM